jgi:hypothetical protein
MAKKLGKLFSPATTNTLMLVVGVLVFCAFLYFVYKQFTAQYESFTENTQSCDQYVDTSPIAIETAVKNGNIIAMPNKCLTIEQNKENSVRLSVEKASIEIFNSYRKSILGIGVKNAKKPIGIYKSGQKYKLSGDYRYFILPGNAKKSNSNAFVTAFYKDIHDKQKLHPYVINFSNGEYHAHLNITTLCVLPTTTVPGSGNLVQIEITYPKRDGSLSGCETTKKTGFNNLSIDQKKDVLDFCSLNTKVAEVMTMNSITCSSLN